MKNLKSITSKSTLLLLAASAAFIFSGCNSTSTNMTSYNSENSSNTQSSTKGETQKQDIPEPEKVNKQDSVKPAETTVASKVTDAQRQEFLDAINAARADTQVCGDLGTFEPAPALKWNNKLDNAAYEHSMDLAESDTFSHTGSGTKSDATAAQEDLGRGSRFYERIKHNGYIHYRIVGENIAAGYDSVQDVVDAWIESPHHCENLMNPKYTEVGMALVEKTETTYGSYWSQEFGGK